MKKFLYLFLLLVLLVGCNKYDKIPIKNEYFRDPYGTTAYSSSVTTSNIDNYLFRDDVQYFDVRYYSYILKEGYIAGFSFLPFREIICGFDSEEPNKLFSYILSSTGAMIGDVGGFKANYEESEQLIKRWVSKDKYIFVISESGLTGSYFLNLLVQLGYDQNKLYNVGGFSNPADTFSYPYSKLENPKYLVSGNNFIQTNENLGLIDFSKLTKIA